MGSLNEILKEGYKAQIINLYHVFSENLLIAENEEQKDVAKNRFKTGLKKAAETFKTAVELSES